MESYGWNISPKSPETQDIIQQREIWSWRMSPFSAPVVNSASPTPIPRFCAKQSTRSSCGISPFRPTTSERNMVRRYLTYGINQHLLLPLKWIPPQSRYSRQPARQMDRSDRPRKRSCLHSWLWWIGCSLHEGSGVLDRQRQKLGGLKSILFPSEHGTYKLSWF